MKSMKLSYQLDFLGFILVSSEDIFENLKINSNLVSLI